MQIVAAILVGLFSISIMLVNWCTLIENIRGSRPASVMFLVGGVAGALSLAMFPSDRVRSLWWIPLVVDYGTLPAAVLVLIGLASGRYRSEQ